MKSSELDIYSYSDFRKFISDRIDELRRIDRKYSFQYIANQCGIKSRSHIKMVSSGKRNISPGLANKLGEVLGLSRRENTFLMKLVDFGQARSLDERRKAMKALGRKRRFREIHHMDFEHFDYLNDKAALALREMVAFPDFRENPGWIADRIGDGIKSNQALRALEMLQEQGFLIRDAKGQLVAAHPHQHADGKLNEAALKIFYESMFRRASDSLDLPGSIRNVGGYTMSVSPKGYERILAIISRTIEEIRTVVDEDEDTNAVYQLVYALFPITTVPERDDHRALKGSRI